MSDETITMLLADYEAIVCAAFRLADAAEDVLDEDDRIVGEKFSALLNAVAAWDEAAPNRDVFSGAKRPTSAKPDDGVCPHGGTCITAAICAALSARDRNNDG